MKNIISLILLTFLCVSCASKKEKQEVIQRAQASEVTSHNELGNTIEKALNESRHLKDQQRKEIEAILNHNRMTAETLAEKSYQFRAVLIQELLAEDFDKSKVKIIKKNIKHIEKNKLNNTLDTIERISRIVSKTKDRQIFNDALTKFERIR